MMSLSDRRKPAYGARVNYTEQKARGYQAQAPRKQRAEMKLIRRAFRLVPEGARVLDVPCGGGRATVFLAENGYQMTSADLSDSMLRIARENIHQAGLEILVESQDVEKLTYADRSFDAIICFRLFHHFPNAEIRQRAVRELCRVADQFIVISYFSPHSFTSLKRQWRAARGGRRSHKHATPLAEVRRYFAAAGFQFVKDFAQLAFVHTLHLAVFKRQSSKAV